MALITMKDNKRSYSLEGSRGLYILMMAEAKPWRTRKITRSLSRIRKRKGVGVYMEQYSLTVRFSIGYTYGESTWGLSVTIPSFLPPATPRVLVQQQAQTHTHAVTAWQAPHTSAVGYDDPA